jgi:hypothetical protein
MNYYFRQDKLHDNPVVNKILLKRRDGLCEKASGLATVFHVVTDFDIALLYSTKLDAPAYLYDEDIANMSDILYHEVIKRFPLGGYTCYHCGHKQIPIVRTTILWDINAILVNESANKERAIRKLTFVYATLDQKLVDRINKNYEKSDDDLFSMIYNAIRTQYEVYY